MALKTEFARFSAALVQLDEIAQRAEDMHDLSSARLSSLLDALVRFNSEFAAIEDTLDGDGLLEKFSGAYEIRLGPSPS